MKLRTFLVIAAIIALLYGLGGLLMPQTILAMYGTGISPSEILLMRFFATELLLIAMLNWFSRDLAWANLQPLMTASFYGNLVGFLVALMGTLGGTMNSMGWSAVLIYLLIAVGFGYFKFKGSSTQ